MALSSIFPRTVIRVKSLMYILLKSKSVSKDIFLSSHISFLELMSADIVDEAENIVCV